jgi:hypothetical protein
MTNDEANEKGHESPTPEGPFLNLPKRFNEFVILNIDEFSLQNGDSSKIRGELPTAEVE